MLISLKRLESDTRKLVVRMIARNAPFGEIERAIKRLMDDASIDEAMQREFLRSAARDHGWITEHDMGAAERRVLSGLLSTTLEEFARIGDAISERAIDAVSRGIRSNTPSAEIESAVARAVRGTRGNASAIVDTGLAAFDRAKMLIEVEKAGVERLRLVGPPPSRAWCRLHYRKVYHIDEIRHMSNGTRLSVEYHCGGWRCHHEWEAVID